MTEYPWIQQVRTEAVGVNLAENDDGEEGSSGSVSARDQKRCTCVKQIMEKENYEDSIMMHCECREYACLSMSDIR